MYSKLTKQCRPPIDDEIQVSLLVEKLERVPLVVQQLSGNANFLSGVERLQGHRHAISIDRHRQNMAAVALRQNLAACKRFNQALINVFSHVFLLIHSSRANGRHTRRAFTVASDHAWQRVARSFLFTFRRCFRAKNINLKRKFEIESRTHLYTF